MKLSKMLISKTLRLGIYCLLVASFFSSCTPSKEQLEADGYQVFNEYALAIKAPCKFEIDIQADKSKTSGSEVVLACIYSPSDSALTMDELEEAEGSTIFQVVIYTGEEKKEASTRIESQLEAISYFKVREAEEVRIDGYRSIIYDFPGNRISEAFIPRDAHSYCIAITSDSSRHKLEEVLNSIKFGHFE